MTVPKDKPMTRSGGVGAKGTGGKTSPITKALLIITLAALVAVSVYYVFAVYIPAQNQAATINSTIEEQR